jgi:hypothetical protein
LDPKYLLNAGREALFSVHPFYFLFFSVDTHAEGLVDPKVRVQKKVTDFGYPRACTLRKLKIGYGSSLYQLFSKCDLNS